MATQTPELEGELLDEPVLRLTDAKPLRQWPIFAGKLQAGELNGLSNGTIMALYNDAADADDKVLAYGEIEAAGATQSRVAAIAYPCGAPLAEDGSCPTPPDEAAFKKGRFARVVEPGVDLSVVLSEPVRVDPNDGHDYGAAIAALESAVHSGGLSRRVSLNKSGYDVAVGLLDGKLAFSATGGQFDANGAGSSPRLTLPDNSAAATAVVASAIDRIAKVMALQRMAGIGAEEKFGLGNAVSLIKAKPEAVREGACSDDRANYDAAGRDRRHATAARRLRHPVDLHAEQRPEAARRDDPAGRRRFLDRAAVASGWRRQPHRHRRVPNDRPRAERARRGRRPASSGLSWSRCRASASRIWPSTISGRKGCAASRTRTARPAGARALMAVGLNDMDRAATSQPPRIEEEISISIKPFYVGE